MPNCVYKASSLSKKHHYPHVQFSLIYFIREKFKPATVSCMCIIPTKEYILSLLALYLF